MAVAGEWFLPQWRSWDTSYREDRKVLSPTTNRPRSLVDISFHYCPGCGHGIIHRLVAEVIDELGIQGQTIGVASVGCSVHTLSYFDLDMQQAAHGRAPAVATGIKRVLPKQIVFTYQGDGDLGAIGIGEMFHATARGEKITVIYVNNAVYGMTGGQMAPTTLIGQATSTTPDGRLPDRDGFPIKVAELVSMIDGSAFVARTSVHNPVNVARTKKAIRMAFQAQMNRLGLGLVEVLSPCPTNWHLSPSEAMKWIENVMIKSFPLGIMKSLER
ncbi:MAG: 2-oxoglutarate oxidoreductase [Clostridia bacterium]|nr:2-oxoglutarate oxidoreductase [Clostridia bacterium]